MLVEWRKLDHPIVVAAISQCMADMFSCFDRIPACDGRTDRQTDGQADNLRRHMVCAMTIASRGKNDTIYSHSYIGR